MIQFLLNGLLLSRIASSNLLCKYFGYAIGFSTISFYCWITILVYDLYLTVKSKRFGDVSGSKSYLSYSAIAYSFPIFVLISTIFIDFFGAFHKNFMPHVLNNCFCSLINQPNDNVVFYRILPAAIVAFVGSILTVISLIKFVSKKFSGEDLPDDVSSK
jgi:hypothetical protein